MPNENVFIVEVDPSLREQFLAEAKAAQRPPSQLLHDLMAEFVDRQRDLREHDAWFRGEVERGRREADDPSVRRIPNDHVNADWRRQRADLQNHHAST